MDAGSTYGTKVRFEAFPTERILAGDTPCSDTVHAVFKDYQQEIFLLAFEAEQQVG
jgi:hypothetical protein